MTSPSPSGHAGRAHGLGHQWEARNHVLGALANGLTSEEILEAVLQTAPYIGLPAAGQAMTTAARALQEA